MKVTVHAMPTNASKIEVLRVPIDRLMPTEALDAVERLHERGEPAFIAHTNAHTINLANDDPGFLSVLRNADLILNDGKGVMLAARILGSRLPADMNGNFFGPLLLERCAQRGWPVFFLGANPGVAQRAADMLMERMPALKIVGTRDGYFKTDEEAIEAIKSSGAEVVFVGMGNPLQERWIDRCRDRTGARIHIGVGAFYDFITHEVPRAPAWMNRWGLEWLHRLFQEPKRMWRRYLLGNPKFVWRVVKQRFGS